MNSQECWVCVNERNMKEYGRFKVDLKVDLSSKENEKKLDNIEIQNFMIVYDTICM